MRFDRMSGGSNPSVGFLVAKGVAKWLKAVDCKSIPILVRGSESLSHYIVAIVDWLCSLNGKV